MHVPGKWTSERIMKLFSAQRFVVVVVVVVAVVIVVFQTSIFIIRYSLNTGTIHR
jgi:hypothetical protein